MHSKIKNIFNIRKHFQVITALIIALIIIAMVYPFSLKSSQEFLNSRLKYNIHTFLLNLLNAINNF